MIYFSISDFHFATTKFFYSKDMSLFSMSRNFMDEIRYSLGEWDINVRRRECEYYYVKLIMQPLAIRNHEDYRDFVGEILLNDFRPSNFDLIFDCYVATVAQRRLVAKFIDLVDAHEDEFHFDFWAILQFDQHFVTLNQDVGNLSELQNKLPIFQYFFDLELQNHVQEFNNSDDGTSSDSQ